MFNVVGCLGCSIGSAASVDEAITLVRSQIPVGKKKQSTMRNALSTLRQGQQYHVDYGHSGVTVERL